MYELNKIQFLKNQYDTQYILLVSNMNLYLMRKHETVLWK